MPAAPFPSNEATRFAALLSCGILDTPRDPAFDYLTTLASELLEVPICLVSLVADDRQWFKSRVGLDATQTPRQHAICAHAILHREPLVIEDTALDDRTIDNPLVTGEPGIRFYAGCPIILDDGHAVGTLCVIDTKTRSLDARALRILRSLAEQAAKLLQLSRETTRTRRLESEALALRRSLNDHTLFSIADRRGRIIDVNDGFCCISGYSRKELLGQDHRILNSGHHPKAFWVEMWKTISRGDSWRAEVCNRAKDGSLYWVDSTNIPQFDSQGNIERFISLRFDITEAKQTQAELQNARQLLEETSRLARVGGWEIDLDTMTPRWSDEVCRIHGVEPGYVPDLESAINFYAPRHRAMVTRVVAQAIQNGEPWDFEAELITAQNEKIWVRSLGNPVMDEHRTKCLVLRGALQDISQQVKTKQDLEDLKSRFERAIDGTSDGLWDYDLATGIVWYADQFRRLLGYDEREFESFGSTIDTFTDLLHKDDRGPTLDAVKKNVECGDIYDVEYRLRTRDGDYRWFRARGDSVRDDSGRAIRMSGSITDIHERREMETRFDLATTAAQIGLWDWEIKTGRVYYSDVYFTMLGYELGEFPMVLETWSSLVHPDDLSAALEAVARHHADPSEPFAIDSRLKTKDGSWLWVRSKGEVIEHDADGAPTRMIGVHIDIQAMRDALDTANKANNAKSEFLANMSHEIRTPMTAILGYADFLGGDCDMDLTLEAVSSLRSNASHLLTIINDILDVSKIEAGQMSVEQIAMDPARIVRDVAAFVEPRARGKGVECRVQFDSPVPERIISDPTRLRQILLNIAGNAIKFTEIGSITIHVSYDPNFRQMQFRVVDTGIGMTSDQCDMVARFEAFSQADSSTNRRFGGSGLGLRISAALAAMLGGGITIESEYGVGSSVNLTIDAVNAEGAGMIEPEIAQLEPPRATEDAASKPNASALAGVRIILAEDGPDNQRLISFHLKKAGAEVQICDNGLIAVEAIEAADTLHQPHIVLMDMQMPELDGYQATRRLRENGFKIPIIALTAHAMHGDRERCLSAGCDDYLTKPLDTAKLIKTCAQLAASSQDQDNADGMAA